MKTQAVLFASLLTLATTSGFAYKNITSSTGKKANGTNNSLAAGCAPATNYQYMEYNNVRFRVNTGGDFWYDFAAGKPGFEVPKNSGKHAIFSGSLWMGGQDISGQLKLAGQTYRQNGNDFWAGPLSTVDAEVDAVTCAQYDRFWETSRAEVEKFYAWKLAVQYDAANGTDLSTTGEFENYTIPESILTWPAHGRTEDPYNEAFYLAPFTDVDGDGIYNPQNGDFPGYDIFGTRSCGADRAVWIFGDNNIWWVFNDKGNIHTETSGNSIGMEIHAQAFTFSTNDEVNSMTFMNFELINRSTFTLTETYFGVNVDTDLGNYQDDYVGCDVMRGLGYCYNGDDFDEDNQGALGYGANPPAIGVDFFEGPYQDNDGIDNAYGILEGEALNGIGYGDSIVDNERFGMRRFVYYNNDGSNIGNPQAAKDYYNYLRGIWRNGEPMTYGGNGIGGTVPCYFMFPGESDQQFHWGTNGVPMPPWTEVSAGNQAGDRRFVQSAGPFTLTPGAYNNITLGTVFAQATSGGALASVEKMKLADQKTQALFDNCFKLLDGPHAPQLKFQELNQQIIVYITNPSTSNNYQDKYAEVDPFIIIPDTLNGQVLTEQEKTELATYKFQGYKVYQVIDNTVSPEDLDDPDKARLVFQCDIQDSVSQIINYEFDDNLGTVVPKEMVNGANKGVQHSFVFTEDQFASGTKTLVNYKTYHFIAVAYAYNNYLPYDPGNPDPSAQQKPYIESRKEPTGPIQVYSSIPHPVEIEEGGLQLNAQYGDQLPLTRLEGKGNGGNALEIDYSVHAGDLFRTGVWRMDSIKYMPEGSPVQIKIVDPINVLAEDFALAFYFDEADSTAIKNRDYGQLKWKLYKVNGVGDATDTVYSDNTIEVGNEQLILDWGISVLVEQVPNVGTQEAQSLNNGLISASIDYVDPGKQWLSGVSDIDGDQTGRDWIKSGTTVDGNSPVVGENTDEYGDESQVFEGILGGIIAPYFYTSSSMHGPHVGHSELYKAQYSGGYNFNVQYIKYGETALNSLGADKGLEFFLGQLNSVDIVFTNDKSKWTRCPVLEMQDLSSLAEGEAEKFHLRRAPSVDKDGNPYTNYPSVDTLASTDENAPNYISAYGMGWFPGYAVDVETGERLNIAFGEDSWLKGENGDDMLWNPTENIAEGVGNQNIRFGGKHYIFIFKNAIEYESDEVIVFPSPEGLRNLNSSRGRMPAYDEGRWMVQKLKEAENGNTNSLYDVFHACTWTMLPLKAPNEKLLATDATIKLRVMKPFERYGVEDAVSYGESLEPNTVYFVNQGPVIYQGRTYYRGDTLMTNSTDLTFDVSGDMLYLNQSSKDADSTNVLIPTKNAGLPLYNFGTRGYEPVKGNAQVLEDALECVKVVPNPYYAFSEYETDRLDNRVRITCLPEQANITIYSLDGTLIRRYEKDDPNTFYVDWDLKNSARVPVASGIYLIHVEVPGVGQKVIKWYGMMRPFDLDTF